MRNSRGASGHQGENEWQWKKKEQEHKQHFLHKTCNWEVPGRVSRCGRAKKKAKKCTKKCAARAKLLLFSFFAN